MEEQIIKESEAQYFKSATVVLKGSLILTSQRVMYSGTQERIKMNHGVVGNVIRDKVESSMGYDNPAEQAIFDIPISEVAHGLKRFGLSKRLVLTDADGNEFKLVLKKSEREEWPDAIDNAKKQLA